MVNWRALYWGAVPFYGDNINNKSAWESHSGIIVTFGVKLGINQINLKKK